MTANIIPFARPATTEEAGLDDLRIDLADEIAAYALSRVSEELKDRGLGLDPETTIVLLLACRIIETEAAVEDGAA